MKKDFKYNLAMLVLLVLLLTVTCKSARHTMRMVKLIV